MLKHLIFLLPLLPTMVCSAQSDAELIRKIYDEVLANGKAYEQLRFLTKEIGHRLSGSPQAAAAVEYTRDVMEKLDFDNVFVQEVSVPHWVRGRKETGRILNTKKYGTIDVNVTALGNSVGTGQRGVFGKVLEVENFIELLQMEEDRVKGKIVFFNRRMDPRLVNTFLAYGLAGDQRRKGPAQAAKFGAIGVIVRSLTQVIDDHPHTGSTWYEDGVPEIPAIAISTKDADLLSSILDTEPEVDFYFETHSQMMGEKVSYNVIGELEGRDGSDEYILVGGHLDSWDLGEGAHDDGAGCVQAIEVLRALKTIGYRPRKTLRAVMFMNEENGLRGGSKYAEMAEMNGETHIAAMESDRGGFSPKGFTLEMNEFAIRRIREWKELFEPYEVFVFEPGGGGADISPLKSQGVPLIGFKPDDQRYFKYHHSAIDTFDKVDERELHMGAATMAALIYLIDKYGL